MTKLLMNEKIAKAQKEINDKKKYVENGKMRQHYHLMPQCGWMNDPNGLIYFKGQYHVFYQTNPYSGFWDSMHWGHAVSKDLLHWEYLPLALAPSEEYDDFQKGGCFSGSAIEHDGKMYLFYTGTANHGHGNVQTQCLAISEDGIHFEKYTGNPLITVPEGIEQDSFRDPKVWKHDEKYYMVIGGSRNHRGLALIFESEDLYHWNYLNVLSESRGEWGFMWECPDFYPLGDKYVLTFSPMGSGDHTSVYLVGDFDYETGRFDSHVSGEMDWGFDYYAPQSIVTPDGRRLVISWANEWEWMPLFKDWGPTYQEGWCGFFNLIREVKLGNDGTLQFVPIEEMKNIREDGFCQEEMLITEDPKQLKAGDGISFEMKFVFDLKKTDADSIEMKFRCGDGKETCCIFDLKNGELSVDRQNSDGWSTGVSRSVLLVNDKSELDVHIFSDQSSLEIFTDKYRNNHSNNIFAGDQQDQLSISAHGGKAVIRNYESYKLKDCFRKE